MTEVVVSSIRNKTISLAIIPPFHGYLFITHIYSLIQLEPWHRHAFFVFRLGYPLDQSHDNRSNRHSHSAPYRRGYIVPQAQTAAKPKKGTSKLDKLSELYATSNQSAETRQKQ